MPELLSNMKVSACYHNCLGCWRMLYLAIVVHGLSAYVGYQLSFQWLLLIAPVVIRANVKEVRNNVAIYSHALPRIHVIGG